MYLNLFTKCFGLVLDSQYFQMSIHISCEKLPILWAPRNFFGQGLDSQYFVKLINFKKKFELFGILTFHKPVNILLDG